MTLAARCLTYGLFLYVLALHASMAAMEILVWAICLTELILLARRKSMPPFPDWKPVAGLVVCIAIGLLLNPAGRGFWFQLGFMRWAILLWILPQVLRDLWSPEFERKLIMIWLIACFVSCAYALFQTFTGIDLIRPNAHVVSFSHGVWRPVGFFSRSLAFAYSFGFSFLALLLPVWRKLPKTVTIPFALIGFATIAATESRGAWIGLIAAAIIYLALEHRRYLIGFILVLAVAIGLGASMQNEVGTKVYNLITLTLDHSSDMRFHLWLAYFQMWKEHPFFGVGLLQGDLLVPQYYQQLGIGEEFTSNAHNIYLQWLAGAGIFALGFFLWLCGKTLYRAWKLAGSSPWGWSILLAQIFLLVGGFSENNFFTAITLHMVIFNWAILIALEQVLS